MEKKRLSRVIDAAQVERIQAYVRRQFASLSWWPTEEPLRARQEFEAVGNSPEALAAWCEKWLNAGQRRQLEQHLRDRATERP
ncbi:hypothetical protein [Candidatus Methylocalor cossyra]|uniref:Uncharacterized protein n=1 Tax=Candidatus Methylocalor cossyra TaxID=3108543 RepID=A0ABM9NEE4_9GAMM